MNGEAFVLSASLFFCFILQMWPIHALLQLDKKIGDQIILADFGGFLAIGDFFLVANIACPTVMKNNIGGSLKLQDSQEIPRNFFGVFFSHWLKACGQPLGV